MPRTFASAGPAPTLDRTDTALYATLILVWGTSWIAIRGQLGEVAPVVSLVWRFLLSSAIGFAIALARRERLGFPLRMHGWFVAAGVSMFSSNFLLFYLAGAHIPTGLLAVVFALASPINLGFAALFFGRPAEPRVLVGAAIGVSGVAALYAPEILGTGLDIAALGGLGLAVAGTVLFCLGNMASAVIQREGAPDVAAAAWGMGYGALWLLILSLASGAHFAFDWRPPYVISLGWLALGSSVAAFIAYLALIKRVGPARAGFATVLFPVVALAISSVFEDYHWGPLALLGLALVAAGNVVVLGLAPKRFTPPARRPGT